MLAFKSKACVYCQSPEHFFTLIKIIKSNSSVSSLSFYKCIMRVALASPSFPKSITDGLFQVEKLIKDAAKEQAEIICFPESYIPGYHGEGYKIEEHSPEKLQSALNTVCEFAREYSIAVILPMDWYH